MPQTDVDTPKHDKQCLWNAHELKSESDPVFKPQANIHPILYGNVHDFIDKNKTHIVLCIRYVDVCRSLSPYTFTLQETTNDDQNNVTSDNHDHDIFS